MESISDFLSEIRLDNGAIWLADESLKLFTSKKMQTDETRQFISNNRSSLISILRDNCILSKEKFAEVTILRNDTESHYPLSAAQERLWFIEQLEEGTNAYHIPTVLELGPGTEAEGVKYALQQIVLRHQVLRSTIQQPEDLDYPVQKVNNRPLVFEETILSDAGNLNALIRADINRPFDLSAENPLRAKFYKVISVDGESRTILLINIHHIAADGWTLDIFKNELFAYYEAYMANDHEFTLPALAIQYKDFALWQKAYLKREVLQGQLNYWKNKLSGFQTLDFPADHARQIKNDYRGASLQFTIGAEASANLRALAQSTGTTLNSVLLSGLNILLSKYTGQQDIVTGSPVANRHLEQLEGLIGFFVNTVVNRTILGREQTFRQLVTQVHNEQVQMQKHQDIPFEKLVEELNVERDPGRNPVFQILFSVQNFGAGEDITQAKTYFRPFSVFDFYDVEKFDLSFTIDSSNVELQGRISYSTSLFEKNTVESLAAHYVGLLTQLSRTPDAYYSKIGLLGAQEYKRVIYDWNVTEKDFPRDKTINKLFEEQARRNPNSIALVCNGQQLTYAELNTHSNQLARRIRAEYYKANSVQIPVDTVIALYLDRGFEMIIGILGVLKAGAAYVPINIDHPKEKTDFILADTGAQIILSQQRLLSDEKLPAEKVMLIDLTEGFYQTESDTNLEPNACSTDLAYVIYTSGTTGNPKGVKIEHHSVVNKISYFIANHGVNAAFNIGAKIPYSFDPSVREIFIALLSGARLTIVATNLYNTDELIGIIQQQQINLLIFIPSHLNLFLLSLKNHSSYSEALTSLKIIYSCGEILPGSLVLEIKNHLPDVKLINQYGPSEACLCSFEFDTSKVDNINLSRSVPVGKIIDNGKAYVLDTDFNPSPINAVGEIYIGGDGLSRGYLNLPELTEQRFIANPFATEQDKKNDYTRLYRTDDLGRWLPNGDLEFIGRNDDQVKIRGYRIEMGEVEAALRRVDGVGQCCVITRDRDTETGPLKYLVAYYVTKKNSTFQINPKSITAELQKMLPEYMIPDVFIELDFLPLTTNGKLDKRALPVASISQITEGYVEPVTDKELVLCAVWKNVLGLDRVGLTDDFFRIGGNSMLALHASRGMAKALNQDFRVADLFRFKSIGAILKNSALQRDNFNGLAKEYHPGSGSELEKMIFVHPGGAGAEVYQDLADLLAQRFKCIGIDNYNLHAANRITTLHEIAKLYLREVEQNYVLSQPVNLLGWSYGGLLSLEMASILEQRGFSNINVFLLDTILKDAVMWSILDSENKDDARLEMSLELKTNLPEGVSESEIERYLSCFETDREISRANISNRLQHTHVLLFKALKDNPVRNASLDEPYNQHKRRLAYNNVELVANYLRVINLDCHHHDILESAVLIADALLEA
ncbi:amino acid adenylation domain-containing protein [Mucilaginibacter calamicampi]|uniref:Amino acid adenylation domain-containing protein n=1 Tax=Mucilaginibacter calamicampi TaxID=1302352 RepID=A0ABW2YYG1_9SPHI